MIFLIATGFFIGVMLELTKENWWTYMIVLFSYQWQ